jgi:hypothetical protein
VKTRRTALLCLVFAALAQLSSGCYCCNRPFLCRPIFHPCWNRCGAPAGGGCAVGGGYPVGAPADCGCASSFSAPIGAPMGPGPVFTGSPMPLTGPSVQQIPMGTPLPMTGGVQK